MGFIEGKNVFYLGNKFKIFYITSRTKKYSGEEKFSIMYSLTVKYDDIPKCKNRREATVVTVATH